MADPLSPDQRLECLGSLIDALPDPCLLLDRRLVVLHRNQAAARDVPELRRGTLLTSGLRAPALLSAVDQVRRDKAPQIVELHQPVPNETWHRVHIAPLEGEDWLLVTLHNLTEEKRVDQLRSDFIANVSHELRTPLTSLIGFLDTLLGPAARDEAARRRFLSIMRQQAGRMSNLIDDLLSLSRIELRQHLRPTGSVDLPLLLSEVRESFEGRAAEAGVQVEIVGEGPAIVSGDRAELFEVFENLLDNAIKYGGAGGRVEIVIGPGRPGFDYTVSVVDHGEGIAAEHVPRLTERFYRVDAESSRRKKGTGLGLAIVKHIVNRHRGQLTIRSTPGQGTRVDVQLPP